MKYKLEQLNCPSCGAGIDMDIQGRKAIFCPFCGSQFAVDDGEKVITKNINIRKDINIHKRYTNDAAIEKELRKDRANERQHVERKWDLLIGVLLIFMAFSAPFAMSWMFERQEQKSIDAGMIKVGQSSDDMKGKKFPTVKAQLESVGFTNITTVDLDDAGWFINQEDTIESVSIGGDTSFSSDDYFNPGAKVIISYH